jgi:hypothetical protein
LPSVPEIQLCCVAWVGPEFIRRVVYRTICWRMRMSESADIRLDEITIITFSVYTDFLLLQKWKKISSSGRLPARTALLARGCHFHVGLAAYRQILQ